MTLWYVSFLPSSPKPSQKVYHVPLPISQGRGEHFIFSLNFSMPNVGFSLTFLSGSQTQPDNSSIKSQRKPPKSKAKAASTLSPLRPPAALPGTYLVPALRATAGVVLLGLKWGMLGWVRLLSTGVGHQMSVVL